MPKVFVPQKDMVIECATGKNLMDLLIEAGLPVASSCQGEGICSKCLTECSPTGTITELEIQTITRNKRDLEGHRLCCQVFVENDLTVKTTYW